IDGRFCLLSQMASTGQPRPPTAPLSTLALLNSDPQRLEVLNARIGGQITGSSTIFPAPNSPFQSIPGAQYSQPVAQSQQTAAVEDVIISDSSNRTHQMSEEPSSPMGEEEDGVKKPEARLDFLNSIPSSVMGLIFRHRIEEK